MSSAPLFSVIIPTYHRNDLLAKCLDCLTPGVQTLTADQYEVIVTDDGSETTAEEMIQTHYPWAKWVAGPRKGPAANRNNGAKYAGGKWLVFTDDDCLPISSWLLSFKEAIVQQFQVYEGKTTCEAGICSPLECAPINTTGGYLWSCNMMIKANLFQVTNGFDENFPYPHLEDTDLRERLQKDGHNILFVKGAVVDHPPKRLASGYILGAFHESDVYYWHLKKKEKLPLSKLLKDTVHFRLLNILKYPFGVDYLKALASLASEFFYVVIHARKWYKNFNVNTNEDK